MKKSGDACSALAVIKQNSEVAIFATQLGWLMTEEQGIGDWTQKRTAQALALVLFLFYLIAAAALISVKKPSNN